MVKAGQTYATIAALYKTTEDVLRSLNGSVTLKPGKVSANSITNHRPRCMGLLTRSASCTRLFMQLDTLRNTACRLFKCHARAVFPNDGHPAGMPSAVWCLGPISLQLLETNLLSSCPHLSEPEHEALVHVAHSAKASTGTLLVHGAHSTHKAGVQSQVAGPMHGSPGRYINSSMDRPELNNFLHLNSPQNAFNSVYACCLLFSLFRAAAAA